MSGINWKRLVAGGIVATIAMTISEFAFEPLVGPAMEGFFTSLGKPVPGEEAMPLLLLTFLAAGLLTVWLYAAIRPRLGAGPRTAIVAGVVSWALSCLLPNISLYAFGLLTAHVFWLVTICPLVGSVAGALAGGWVYRE